MVVRLRVPNKMQVLDFQTLAFFFFPFAPRLHHQIGFFGSKSIFFYISSTKIGIFMDRPYILLLPSTKTGFIVDNEDNIPT